MNPCDNCNRPWCYGCEHIEEDTNNNDAELLEDLRLEQTEQM